MSRYEGLDSVLRAEVKARDGEHCRWCGRYINCDAHHIRYRRGSSDDVASNLIMLCRQCHGFVHGTPNARREIIPKIVAQQLLWDLIDLPGQTGMALWRQRKAQFKREGLCEHGQFIDSCHICLNSEDAK